MVYQDRDITCLEKNIIVSDEYVYSNVLFFSIFFRIHITALTMKKQTDPDSSIFSYHLTQSLLQILYYKHITVDYVF